MQQQTTDWRPGVKHMSMLECARGLVKAKGVAGGLYRGFCALAWRYVEAEWIAWFGCGAARLTNHGVNIYEHAGTRLRTDCIS